MKSKKLILLHNLWLIAILIILLSKPWQRCIILYQR